MTLLHPVILFNYITLLAWDCVCFYNSFQLIFHLASYAIDLAALPDYTIGTTLIVLHISYTTQHNAIYYKFYVQ